MLYSIIRICPIRLLSFRGAFYMRLGWTKTKRFPSKPSAQADLSVKPTASPMPRRKRKNRCASTDLVMNKQRHFNGGYLFLQSIYYELGVDKIRRAISAGHLFRYDLNAILSRLIYTRTLFSKNILSTHKSGLLTIHARNRPSSFPPS